jgi:glycerophosphoryl diester phosphodiesterase
MVNPLLDLNARIVVAHRGNRVAVPENTIEALRSAVEMGADAVEFDVRLTRDGVPVLLHDPALDRTTNGHGLLSRFSFAEVRSLDAGARFSGARAGRALVPALEEVLDGFRETPMVIEVKEAGAVEATERLVRRFGAEGRVIIGSSEVGVMSRVMRTGLRVCASIGQALQLLPTALLRRTPRALPYDVLSLTPSFRGLPVPVLPMAAAAQRVGVPTQVWTVNDPALATRFWAAGVAAILTDDPSAMLRVRPR